MHTLRLKQTTMASLLAFILMIAAGYQATAATYTWKTSVASGAWASSGNWDLTIGPGNANGYPGTGDNAVFNSTASVTMAANRTIAGLSVQSVNSTVTVTLTTDFTLTANNVTVSGISGFNSWPATLILNRNNANTLFILSAQGLSLSNAGVIRSTFGSGVKMELRRGGTGSISMTDVSVDYVGLNVFTTTPTGTPFTTAARFDDDLTFTGSGNILLGEHNLYLGKACTLVTPVTAGGEPGTIGTNSGWIGIPSNYNGSANYSGVNVGYLCREVGPSTLGPLFFPVAPSDGDRSGKYVPVRVEILSYTGSFGNVTPFPHVAVRPVGWKHPANQQTSPVLNLYWVVKGVGTPGEGNSGTICTKVDMYYHNYYKTLGSDNVVFSACYTDNYEDPSPYNIPGWDMTGSQQNNSFSSGDVISVGSLSECVPHFGDYTIGFGNPATDPVPVELTSFSARWMDGMVRLNWETATEINNFGFAIERSMDGKDWNEVGFVPGYGNSNSPKSYVYEDMLDGDMLRAPQVAYRLRQMDRDGTTDYSNIVFVNTGELPEDVELYAAYPNPFNPATTISFSIKDAANVTLKVYNTFGQEIATLLENSAMSAGLHTVPFNGGQLPSGVYMAVLQADGAVQQQKLVLNK